MEDNCRKDQSKISEPMLWIGMYVAAASLLCTLAMAADFIRGLRRRQFWYPCKFFSLNAASLTLVAIAVKLPMDINNRMPGHWDQLSKLTGNAFMCTMMCNIMPSIGTMDNKDLLLNVTALGILVITLFVNVCIQLNTCLIRELILENAVVASSMILLLVILSSSALKVPITKEILELKYAEIHKNEESMQSGKVTIEKLEEKVKKYWMMAETGSLQFVTARSIIPALGLFCYGYVMVLDEAGTRVIMYVKLMTLSRLLGVHCDYYEFRSDYKWSTLLILVIQSIGVVVGTIAPLLRLSTLTRLNPSKKRSNSYPSHLKLENYWIQKLKEWKESPLTLRIRRLKYRKLVQDTKNLIVNLFIGAIDAIDYISIFFALKVWSCWCCCISLKRKPNLNASNNPNGSESEPGTGLDLNGYVLQLESEEKLPQWILKPISDDANKSIQKAKKRQPQNLMELLKKSTTFKGVAEFDTDQVPSLHPEECPNCWALPVVTLTSIAIAIPNIEKCMVDQLLHSVSEGLLYVSLVEKVIDTKGDLVKIRKAADIMRAKVELYQNWFDEDLQRMAQEMKNSEESLRRLAEIAEKHVMEFMRNTSGDPYQQNPLNWPVEVIGANSMYRISRTILVNYQGNEDEEDKTDEKLFEQLSITIADIIGACLTNLPRVITMKCFCSATEKRQESVQLAARLLGETEEIIKILQQRDLPSDLHPET